MKRAAVLAFDDTCRTVLERDRCPHPDTRTAAWLLCNPSTADAMMAAQADVFVVAFGAAPWRSHRGPVLEALRVWLPDDGRVPECLGLTPDGAPLHLLARGKFAVLPDCAIFEWPGVLQL